MRQIVNTYWFKIKKITLTNNEELIGFIEPNHNHAMDVSVNIHTSERIWPNIHPQSIVSIENVEVDIDTEEYLQRSIRRIKDNYEQNEFMRVQRERSEKQRKQRQKEMEEAIMIHIINNQ